MTVREIERKTGYFITHLLIDDCIENEKINYEKVLKKILLNNFFYYDYDMGEGIDLRERPEIFISSEGQSTKDDFENLLNFIQLILEEAKSENTEFYTEYAKIFDRILEDCKNSPITVKGYNEYFYVRILENLDLFSIVPAEYTEKW